MSRTHNDTSVDLCYCSFTDILLFLSLSLLLFFCRLLLRLMWYSTDFMQSATSSHIHWELMSTRGHQQYRQQTRFYSESLFFHCYSNLSGVWLRPLKESIYFLLTVRFSFTCPSLLFTIYFYEYCSIDTNRTVFYSHFHPGFAINSFHHFNSPSKYFPSAFPLPLQVDC